MSSAPRLRPNLRFVKQSQNGTTVHIVKDPVSLKYFRFGEREVGLMQLIDGRRSLAELAQAARVTLDMETNEGAVERFVQRLKEMGLAERTQEERSALLMEFARRSRVSRMRGDGGTLLRMRFSLGDPDALFARMNDMFAVCFTRWFVVASVGLFAVYGLVLSTHWPAFSAGLSVLYTPQAYTLSFVVLLYMTALVIFLVHEFGHGVMCKHYGGEVHEMGVMLIYFTPAFYCNVNDAWTFESRAQRLWVTFAGGWVQLILASIAAIVWMVTESGTAVHDVAFIAMLIGGGMTVLINFNPLIPLDGYYALVDWLGIPNLRARAFEYVGASLKRTVLRLNVALPQVTPREARIFLVYGILSQLYIVFLLSVLAIAFGKFLGHRWGGWGIALFLFLMWRLTHKLRAGVARSWTSLNIVARVRTAHKRVGTRRALAAAAIIVLPLIVPWTIRVPGVAVAEPQDRMVMRAAEDARVESVLVRQGDTVAAGAVVAILRNPQLELEWTRTQAAIATLEREINISAGAHDFTARRAAELELNARRDMLERLRVRREALVLRAAFAARVVTPHMDRLVGGTIEAGDSLFELHRSENLRARILLAERDAADLERGDVARIKFPVRSSWTWQSPIAEISSAARNGNVELIVPLARSDISSPLRAGMTGKAKIAARRTTIAGAAVRSLRRTFRTDLWL